MDFWSVALFYMVRESKRLQDPRYSVNTLLYTTIVYRNSMISVTASVDVVRCVSVNKVVQIVTPTDLLKIFFEACTLKCELL